MRRDAQNRQSTGSIEMASLSSKRGSLMVDGSGGFGEGEGRAGNFGEPKVAGRSVDQHPENVVDDTMVLDPPFSNNGVSDLAPAITIGHKTIPLERVLSIPVEVKEAMHMTDRISEDECMKAAQMLTGAPKNAGDSENNKRPSADASWMLDSVPSRFFEVAL